MQKITDSPFKVKISLWVPVVAYAALIFYLSDQSQTPSIDVPFLDKFLHTIEYAIFGFLLTRAFQNSGFNLERKTALSISIIVAFLYGISDEIHQAFVLNRTASIFDALFDLIGGGLGSYFYPVRDRSPLGDRKLKGKLLDKVFSFFSKWVTH